MAFIKFSFSFSVNVHLKYRVNRWISTWCKSLLLFIPPPKMSFWVFVPLISCPPGVSAELWDSTGDANRAGVGGSWVSVPLDLTRRAPRTPVSTAVSHPSPCLLQTASLPFLLCAPSSPQPTFHTSFWHREGFKKNFLNTFTDSVIFMGIQRGGV